MITDKPIDMSGPALRAFATIAREWRLIERERRELLGGPKPVTLAEWEQSARMRRRVHVPDAVLIRIQLLLQIRIGIKGPMPDPEDQSAWLRVRHLHLDAQTPLTLITRSRDGLSRVRNLVDSWSR